jgi:3-hydroxyisobutyrate dehydrogenase
MNGGLKVGWIGTGVMGLSMCKHLINANYHLSVFNRTPEKAKPILDMGAQWLEPK